MNFKKVLNFKDYLYVRESKKIDESFSGLITEDEDSEKSIRARIKVNKALIWINIHRGFFARLLGNLNIYGSTELDPPTMATNGLNIVYHPDFVLSQSDAAIRFVLCHEILHCVGDHMTRRGNRDPLIWNWAADYAINPILNSEVSGTSFNWPSNEDGTRMGLYEEKYEGMRAEDIYDLLIEDPLTKLIKEINNFGDVIDSDEDLPEPDSEDDIVQEIDRGEEEEDVDPRKARPGEKREPGEKPEPGEKREPGEKPEPGEEEDPPPPGEEEDPPPPGDYPPPPGDYPPPPGGYPPPPGGYPPPEGGEPGKDDGEPGREGGEPGREGGEPGREGGEPGRKGGEPGKQPSGEGKGQARLVGKKVRITEGPNKGRIGTIKQVLPNGDIIIE